MPDVECRWIDLPPPRPMRPLSTARVSRRRTRVGWQPIASIPHGTLVELSRSRDFTSVSQSLESVTNDAELPALEPGVWFWRLRSTVCGRAATIASPTWQFTAQRGDAPSPTAWGTVPDFNGDRFADVALSAHGSSTVYIYDGNAERMLGTPRELRGTPGASYGWSIASAGDTNGDGFADLIVGTIRGATTIHNGGRDGVSPMPSVSIAPPPGSNGFSYVVSSAGDTNGDGYGDIVIGTQAGFVLVVPGSASGLQESRAVRIEAPEGTRQFGTSVAHAGDVNGDGFGDIVVGSQTGERVYVFIGSSLGIETGPTSVVPSPRSNSNFGYSVASAGDVNNDGFADIAVDDGAGSQGGFVFLGGRSGVVARAIPVNNMARSTGFLGSISGGGDLDGDGFADVLTSLGPRVATAVARMSFGAASGVRSEVSNLEGSAPNGGYTVSCVGDIDNDSFDDVVTEAGSRDSAYVHYGRAGGLDPRPTQVLRGPMGESEFAHSIAGLGR